MAETFRQLAVRSEDTELINTLTETSPILGTMPVKLANKGIQNVEKKLKDIVGAKVVDMDAPLEQVSATGELITTDVSYIAGEQEVGKDQADIMGGPQAYFAEYMPEIIEDTGNNLEKSLIYNTLKPYALANGRTQDAGGTNSGNMYSMVCVKWSNANTGLYSEAAAGSGLSFEMTPLSGGNVYKNSENIAVYGQLMKTNIGFQLTNERNVSAIVNIDLAQTTPGTYDALPSKLQIQKMIRDARADANSFIYCHPAVLDALQDEYMSNALRTSVNDEKYSFTFMEFNGVKIVTSFNFLETEATETV